MHWIKHLADILAMPLALGLLFAALAAVCGLRGHGRAARWAASAALIVAYLGSIAPVAELLLAPLERRYPPLIPSASLSAVHYIVVLGHDYLPYDGIPTSAALGDDGVQRLLESVMLMQRLGTQHLLLSGGAPPGEVPSAQGYVKLARALGVPDAAIIVSDRPLDTGAEARAVQGLLGSAPFILVTSAYHMPRALWLMERRGTHPIPAPTGQRAHGWKYLGWRSFLPRGNSLANSERALHEYLGLAALALGFD